MKRAILAIVGTACGLFLLLGFKTHPAPASSKTAGRAIPPVAPSPDQSTGGPAGTSGGSGTRTLTGDTIDTRWGPVQVRVTLSGRKITDVQAVQLPHGKRRDEEINSFAVPQLIQEALNAQSAQIDGVSGATFTSEGFMRSLQSALDRAGQ